MNWFPVGFMLFWALAWLLTYYKWLKEIEKREAETERAEFNAAQLNSVRIQLDKLLKEVRDGNFG